MTSEFENRRKMLRIKVLLLEKYWYFAFSKFVWKWCEENKIPVSNQQGNVFVVFWFLEFISLVFLELYLVQAKTEAYVDSQYILNCAFPA